MAMRSMFAAVAACWADCGRIAAAICPLSVMTLAGRRRGYRPSMRRLVAVLAVLVTTVALAAPTAAQAKRWRPDLEAARKYAATRAGTISFVLRTRHRLYRSDAYRVYRSASVVKAMLLVAYLNHPS